MSTLLYSWQERRENIVPARIQQRVAELLRSLPAFNDERWSAPLGSSCPGESWSTLTSAHRYLRVTMVLEVEAPWKVVLSRIERIDAGEEPTYQAKTYREDYCPLCVAPWPADGECLCGMTR